MKKLVFLFFTLFFCLSCNKEDVPPEPEPGPVPPVVVVDYFDGFNVKDTTGFDPSTILIRKVSENMTGITGTKKNKLWIWLYNTTTKEEIQTWSNDELFKDMTSVCEFNSLLSFEWGYAAVLHFGTYPAGEYPQETGVLFLKKGEKNFGCYDYSDGYKTIAPIEDKVVVNDYATDLHSLDVEGYILSSDEEVVINSVTGYTLRMSPPYFYSGFDKDNKMWFARVEEDGTVIEEWRGTEVAERNVRIHLGYGEYRDHYIDRLFDDLADYHTLAMPWGYVIQPGYRESVGSNWVSGYLEYLFLKDGVVKRIPDKTESAQFTAWYNESVLVKTGKDKTLYTVYSSDGEVILERESASNADIYYTPVSYESYVQVINTWQQGSGSADIRIKKYNITSPGYNPVWDKVIKSVPASTKVTWDVLEKNQNTWTYQFDLLYYSGEKETVTSVVDMDSGEVTYL